MRRVSYKTIEDYMICPLKLYLYNTKTSKLTHEEYYTACARQALYTYFTAIGIGRSVPQATAACTNKFTEEWQNNIHKLLPTKGINFNNKTLLTTVTNIFNPNKDEIVSVKFPLELSLSKNLIVEDLIDLLLIHRSKGTYGKTTYRAIVFEDVYPFDNKRLQMMRASLFRLALQRHIGRETYKSYSFEIRSFNSPDVIIDPESNYYSLIYSLVSNVNKAMETNSFYPTINKEACKHCSYRDVCNLNLMRTQ